MDARCLILGGRIDAAAGDMKQAILVAEQLKKTYTVSEVQVEALRGIDVCIRRGEYEAMNGPNEFMVIGNRKDWDRANRLEEIAAPTLITVGRYDAMTPTGAETMRYRIRKARMQVFEQCAHMALEKTGTYLQVLSDFLASVDIEHGC